MTGHRPGLKPDYGSAGDPKGKGKPGQRVRVSGPVSAGHWSPRGPLLPLPSQSLTQRWAGTGPHRALGCTVTRTQLSGPNCQDPTFQCSHHRTTCRLSFPGEVSLPRAWVPASSQPPTLTEWRKCTHRPLSQLNEGEGSVCCSQTHVSLQNYKLDGNSFLNFLLF